MSADMVDKIARAVLYEGYLLYPYRPSVKSRQRWTFGGIFPQAYSEAHAKSDACCMQTQCLLTECTPETTLAVTLRFLHLQERFEVADDARGVHALACPGGEQYADQNYWQEAVEREVHVDIPLDALIANSKSERFAFHSSRSNENSGNSGLAIIRQQHALEGLIELSATPLPFLATQLTVRVLNATPIPFSATRDQAQLHAFASTHLILRTRHARFVSLTDPPADLCAAVEGCRNVGCWPVLAGEAHQTDTLLVAPIILPDYPQIAPESPGDLFDGTEIDEILTLRIMTLTEAEKKAAASTDPRVREMLARTETLARDQLASLHGTMRGPFTVGGPSHA